jgi:RAP domain.
MCDKCHYIYSRIAILLWGKDAYTSGVSQLSGEQQLKRRHLEMLGYSVVGISSSMWNSMYMAEQNAKTDYLRNKIWPSATEPNTEHRHKRA